MTINRKTLNFVVIDCLSRMSEKERSLFHTFFIQHCIHVISKRKFGTNLLWGRCNYDIQLLTTITIAESDISFTLGK